MLKSILAIQLLSIKYNFADVTICAVEPEKHLYFLWIPLSKVYYILHTTPNKQYTSFTSYTCNSKLSNRKMIITVSHSNKSLISGNWEISKEKQQFIRVIYNCILEQEEPKQDKTVIHKENKIYVITMGHVIAYKNPAIWLKVARSVIELRPNVSFLWLGNGPLIDTYQSAVQNHEKITFKGAVTNTYEYLKVADIYYQPSLYETHGIAVVEAMYKSLPCVVSNVGGLPESVQNGYNGYLVDPENLNQHVEVILNLIDTSDLRARYGGNSYNRYNQLFSFKHFTDQLSRIYN
jgi:glycosyltransferase involved in cell wall biosynthesis